MGRPRHGQFGAGRQGVNLCPCCLSLTLALVSFSLTLAFVGLGLILALVGLGLRLPLAPVKLQTMMDDVVAEAVGDGLLQFLDLG